jgi:hypothetical protein
MEAGDASDAGEASEASGARGAAERGVVLPRFTRNDEGQELESRKSEASGA